MEHAYLKTFIDYGKRDPKYALNNQTLYKYGKKVNLYDGLSRRNGSHSIFDDLQMIVEQEEHKEKNIKLEYYCISGGITEMIQGAFDEHNLSDHFKEIFACSLMKMSMESWVYQRDCWSYHQDTKALHDRKGCFT